MLPHDRSWEPELQISAYAYCRPFAELAICGVISNGRGFWLAADAQPASFLASRAARRMKSAPLFGSALSLPQDKQTTVVQGRLRGTVLDPLAIHPQYSYLIAFCLPNCHAGSETVRISCRSTKVLWQDPRVLIMQTHGRMYVPASQPSNHTQDDVAKHVSPRPKPSLRPCSLPPLPALPHPRCTPDPIPRVQQQHIPGLTSIGRYHYPARQPVPSSPLASAARHPSEKRTARVTITTAPSAPGPTR